MPSERGTYRIVYGVESGSRFHLEGDRWPAVVADCSETGVRFVRADGEARVLEPGDRVAGELLFCNGERVQVIGRVLRVRETEIAVFLDELAIPFPHVMREQIYLRRHYQVQRTLEVGDPISRRRGA